jgi:hypothetical protein
MDSIIMDDDDYGPEEKGGGMEALKSGKKIYVPLEALAEDGITPEIGDEVSAAIVGVVKSIDGDLACIRPSSVNGVEVSQEESTLNKGDDDLEAEMMAEAAKNDEMEGY